MLQTNEARPRNKIVLIIEANVNARPLAIPLQHSVALKSSIRQFKSVYLLIKLIEYRYSRYLRPTLLGAKGLLDLDTNASFVYSSNQSSTSLITIKSDRFLILPWLLKHGADHTVANEDGSDILHQAARYASPKIMNVLATEFRIQTSTAGARKTS